MKYRWSKVCACWSFFSPWPNFISFHPQHSMQVERGSTLVLIYNWFLSLKCSFHRISQVAISKMHDHLVSSRYALCIMHGENWNKKPLRAKLPCVQLFMSKRWLMWSHDYCNIWNLPTSGVGGGSTLPRLVWTVDVTQHSTLSSTPMW